MQYNPEEYETVKSRKERFYKDNKDGRITVKLLTVENIMDYAVFEARVYLNAEDQKNDCPRGVGYATEIRDKELSTSNQGKKYESVNYTSWTENSEESAVGRALDNAGYSGNKKCSREEMDKANRMSKITSPSPLKQTKTDEVVREPIKNTDGDCEVCGATLEFKTGTTKDGKKYQGFFCPNSKVGEKHTVTDFKYI